MALELLDAPLSSDKVVEQVKLLKGVRAAEREPLDDIRRYWKGLQRLPGVVPEGVPREVREMAKMARVNVIGLVVSSLAQSLYVDGFRLPRQRDNVSGWNVWQANRMDARQTGIHRAALAYGTAYTVVTPGSPVPVIRGVSPRNLTAIYGEDPDWPIWALERDAEGLWRLYDDEHIHFVGEKDGELRFIESREHNARVAGERVCPVVRYLDEQDLDTDDEVEPRNPDWSHDGHVMGQVAPLKPLQDQIDLATFNLLVSQHYQAFRQRYVIGWTASSEQELLKAGAARFLTFEDHPQDVEVGELGQMDTKGPLAAREASIRHAGSLSQMPANELLGQLANLGADAISLVDAGRERKVSERKVGLGESHEQTIQLVGGYTGEAIPDDSQVVWRDTSTRSLAATVDALGKLASLLHVPAPALWERIPGVTQQDVESWEAMRAEGDAFANLEALLDRQAGDDGDLAA